MRTGCDFGFGHTMRSLSDIQSGIRSHCEILRDLYALKRFSEYSMTQDDQNNLPRLEDSQHHPRLDGTAARKIFEKRLDSQDTEN